MDTIVNKINNNYNLWTNDMKRERTINKIKRPGIIKIIPNGKPVKTDNGTVKLENREIRGFYTGIRDGVSLIGNDTGTLMVSSQSEKA